MKQMTDIEIAQNTPMLPIGDIAKKAGIPDEYLEICGKYKAKINPKLLTETEGKKASRLVLVTAITPTSAGEGKTTTTVGIADGMQILGKNVIAALREPSLGPVFGLKGGAAGGGYAQVVPMEDINLHFTGDFHAITAANNLLAAMIDNSIQQGNPLNIDPRKVTWRRCMDVNDRELRSIVTGLGGKANGSPREAGFDITAASETMALFCLASDLEDLKKRCARIVVGYTYGKASEQKPVTAGDLHAEGAMAALLRDAVMPNLVQTLEHAPAIIHGGPFANIAHGCNSVIATRTALHLADYVITEAGFGADLGAEKFFDIKCRMSGLRPDAVVLVATVRALKLHGGLTMQDLGKEDMDALERGFPNLMQHISNITQVYHLPCIVAINAFPNDTERETEWLRKRCASTGVEVVVSRAWAEGGKGSVDLAKTIIRICETHPYEKLGKDKFDFAYGLDLPITEKIDTIAKRIYHAKGTDFTPEAKKQAAQLESMGYGNMPVCIAKTQYSFSDNPKALCAPSGFNITVRKIKVSAGAGFLVALTGEIMTMPGLPKSPAAERIDVDSTGKITGLF
ncbi:MAG: formate--tetrahydrofolate ligase [Lachnospiraceae bacterium]|jgi:formate--tetrahydrofolate ligase|nr:formate--tetrahydrofolate ligase [Lachnospiraceae bacterium]